MYLFLYRWYPIAGFACSKRSITAFATRTVYKVNAANKLQYLTIEESMDMLRNKASLLFLLHNQH